MSLIKTGLNIYLYGKEPIIFYDRCQFLNIYVLNLLAVHFNLRLGFGFCGIVFYPAELQKII